jgi:hypothetical protein
VYGFPAPPTPRRSSHAPFEKPIPALGADFLKWETMLHVLAVGLPVTAWLLAKLGLGLPATLLLTLWLVVLCVEYAWAALALVLRRGLVMRTSWAEFDAAFERYCLGKAVSWWRRPVVWLVFPLVAAVAAAESCASYANRLGRARVAAPRGQRLTKVLERRLQGEVPLDLVVAEGTEMAMVLEAAPYLLAELRAAVLRRRLCPGDSPRSWRPSGC